MSEGNSLKKALLCIRGSSWLRRVGSAMLRLPGVGGVLRRLLLRVLPRGERIWYQLPSGPAGGLWLKLEPYLEQRYLSGNPEPGVQEAIARHLSCGDCFYDAGAHIGYYSLLASRLVGEAGRVVAFEPDPANLTVLRENLARNGATNVEVVPAALWNHSGVVAFERSACRGAAVSSRRGVVVEPAGKELEAGILSVEALTLDSFAARGNPPGLIKVDVEGAEIEVLEGAEELIRHSAPVWLFEVHHQAAKVFLENRLGRYGYELEWLPGYPGYDFPRHVLARPAAAHKQ